MTNPFQKATKERARLRLALIGPSGSGKTYTSLQVGTALKNGGRVALVDTERGSASKYADLFDFDVLELETFEPQNYIRAIEAASGAGYDVLILDSLSHAWAGVGGILSFVDTETMKSKSRNAYTEGWRKATPLHNRLVDAMIQADLHLIVTMRAKTEYVMETDQRGKTAPRKVGMAPVQRDGLEYEFDVVGDMDLDNNLVVSKTRCPALTGKMFAKPGDDLAGILNGWLMDGTEPAPRKAPEPTPAPEPAPTATNGNTRPLAPEKVRAFIHQKSRWQDGHRLMDGEPIDTKEVPRVATVMGELFPNLDNKMRQKARHDVLRYLIGVDSTKALTMAESLAITDWCRDQDSAQIEAARILEAMAIEAGQQELPL